MRIVRFLDKEGQVHFGTNQSGNSAELLEGDLFDSIERTGRRIEIDSLLAPFVPVNIFGIGLNYRDSLQQMGAPEPQIPVVFMKPTTAVANPGDPVQLPDCCTEGPEVDFEAELAVIIGRAVRDIPASRAMDHIFGYTAANDITARKWTKKTRTRGKGFDGFCPLGPAMVTIDEIPDPQNLGLRTRVNGHLMQDSSTREMLFSVAELVSYLSQDTTLLPGTLILTGTPAGAGFASDPPQFLKSGDLVEIEVEGIGSLSNRVTTKIDTPSVAA